jgi:hypothetical protein
MIAPWFRRPALGLLFACLLLALACTDPPEKEMHQAQGAIDAARAAGAVEYAADEFRAAEAALKRSTDAVAERDYRQALNYALDAGERARAAAKTAAEARAAARSDAERLLASADDSLARARAVLRAATEAKLPAPQLASRARALSDAESVIGTARDLIASAGYAKAHTALTGLPERLAALASEIGAEVEARSAKRPVRRPGR